MAYDNQTGRDAAPAGILAVAALVRDIEDLAARFAEVTAGLLRREDVGPGQRGLLVVLRRQGPLTMPRLARELEVSRQHVRVLVHPLVERGWLELAPNPDHKRSPLTVLTAEGRGAVKRILRREGEVLAVLQKEAKAVEVSGAHTLLARLASTLREPD